MGRTAAKATAAGTGDLDRLLSLGRVAEILDISERNVKNRCYSGELPSVKLGGRRLVRRSDLKRYMERLDA